MAVALRLPFKCLLRVPDHVNKSFVEVFGVYMYNQWINKHRNTCKTMPQDTFMVTFEYHIVLV